jgi:hypothetical protein
MRAPYTCCFGGCQAVIESQHVACLEHWKRVPKNVRQEVQTRRIVWKDRAAARTYLRDWFLFEIRKALPAVELPAARSRDTPTTTAVEVSGGREPVESRPPRNVSRPRLPWSFAAALERFDAALRELEAGA